MAAKNTKRKPTAAAKLPATPKPIVAAIKSAMTRPERIADYVSPGAALAANLRALAPEAFCEGRLDPARLAALVGEDDAVAADAERYYFTWAGRREATLALQLPPAGALAPCRAESVDFDSTANIYIEADNLEALKLMQRAYAGRVKMIYIDPPYNTGNDFVYADDFRDPLGEYLRQTGQADESGKTKRAKARNEEKKLNGRKHSRWLSMIYPRLFLARSLLREDGVIFVSIDDNEVHHLRLVMNMVFGEDNHVGTIAWKKTSGDNKPSFAFTHDNIMIFGRGSGELPRSKISKEQEKQYKNPDNDSRGRWAPTDYRSKWTREERKYLYYPIVHPKTGEEIYPDTYSSSSRVWGCNQNTHKQNEAANLIWWGVDGKSKEPKKKRFLSGHGGVNVRSVWTDAGTNDQASKALAETFPESADVFDNPKPVSLLKKMITIVTSDDDIIMDFFSGSATTAHAVMELNAEDGGARRCISIQLPEPCADKSEAKKAGYDTIAEIGKERLRRAGKKIRETLNGGDFDAGFRVYKLVPSNFRRWTGVDKPTLENWAKAQEEMLDPILTDNTDAIIAEVMLRECYPLDSRIEKIKVGKNTVYKITDDGGGKTAHLCLDKRIPPRLDIALKLKPDSVLIVRDIALTDEMAMNFALRCRLKII